MTQMETTIESKSISLELANKLVEVAVEKGKELGIPFSIAIVDRVGHLKTFASMDGASVLSLDIAQNKAYSAIANNLATHEWYDQLKNEPALLHGIVHTPRLIIFGGGYPIRLGDELIGGIGVSGGQYTEDMQVCEAALSILEELKA